MAKGTGQLRKELEAAITAHDRYLATPGGGLVGTLRRLEEIKELARRLSDALAAQSSRAPKPWRITYKYPHGGRASVSFHAPGESAPLIRTVLGNGGRVQLSHRGEDGKYSVLDASSVCLLDLGDAIKGYEYGLEATL